MESNGRSKETRRKEGSTKEKKITFLDYITFFKQIVKQVQVLVLMEITIREKTIVKRKKCADRDSNPGLGVGNA